jgi:hypothetical protein
MESASRNTSYSSGCGQLLVEHALVNAGDYTILMDNVYAKLFPDMNIGTLVLHRGGTADAGDVLRLEVRIVQQRPAQPVKL